MWRLHIASNICTSSKYMHTIMVRILILFPTQMMGLSYFYKFQPLQNNLKYVLQQYPLYVYDINDLFNLNPLWHCKGECTSQDDNQREELNLCVTASCLHKPQDWQEGITITP